MRIGRAFIIPAIVALGMAGPALATSAVPASTPIAMYHNGSTGLTVGTSMYHNG
jgi:hypothetical protein